MLFKLKTTLLTGLLDEIKSEANKGIKEDIKNKKDKSSSKKGNFNLPSFPDKKNKSILLKVLAALAIGSITYLVFFHNSATKIEIDKVEWIGDRLSLQAVYKKTKYTFKHPDDYRANGAWSSRLTNSSQEDIYDVFLYTENNSIVTFRVTRSKADTSKEANKLATNWNYLVSGGNIYSKNAVPDSTSTTTNTHKHSCVSSNKEKIAECSTDGNNCPCCEFTNWIDLAILNTQNPNRHTAASVFFSLLPTILYLGFFLFLVRGAMRVQGVGGANSIFKIGQSLSKTVKSNVLFSDVAGLVEEKAELEEMVDYLKSPIKYKVMGARVPRGVILYGPPGTGKTLLAKAVSGEADVPFIEVSGATFDDMYVGSGAKRVRDLFTKAKKLSPCIVFIDEIDAVAGKRGNKFTSGGSGGVYDQTINQLLSEMDGFNTEDGIIIMAATNRLDSIDEAVLRPGRFDRHIQVALPNIKDRTAILKVHAKNKNLSSSVNLEDIARKTPGFSGAQLENVLNEATLLAVRLNKKVIDREEIEEAIDRVIGGPAKKSHRMSDIERKQVAYHEAGHAIAGLYSKEGEVVEKITIIARGNAAGYMMSAPEKQETYIKRKDELLSTAVTTLAGRASEEIFFGAHKISTGAANDLFKVTNLVRNMIAKFGMSEKLGLLQYEPSEGITNPYKDQYSEKTSQLLDEEAERIIREQYQKAKEIILAHEQELLLIVECLLLLETIDRNQINYIHTNLKLPQEAFEMKCKLANENKRIDLSPTTPDVIVPI